MPPKFLAVCSFAGALSAQNLSTLTSDVKVEIDNPRVRVLRLKQGPNGKTPLHEHPDMVVIYLTDLHRRVTLPDGKTQEINRKAGEVVWSPAVKHSDENLSGKPEEVVFIELKPEGAGIKSQKVTLDPVKLDPEHHLVPVENDRVRVLRTILEPKIKSPMHEHPPYVVVYLTELHTTMKLGNGKEVDNPRRPGGIAWRDFMKHETLNIGEKTAVEIQVELK